MWEGEGWEMGPQNGICGHSTVDVLSTGYGEGTAGMCYLNFFTRWCPEMLTNPHVIIISFPTSSFAYRKEASVTP